MSAKGRPEGAWLPPGGTAHLGREASADVHPVFVSSPGASPRFATLPPLSLYVHVPWCLRKCPYCDFNSHEARGAIPDMQYVAALLRDLELALPGIWGRRVATIFIGGGTPSLLSAQAIEHLLSGIRALLPVTPAAEVTLEANPGTFERAQFRDYRSAGVTRLSIGVQSFTPRLLEALGRVHDADEARAAAEAALQLFDEVNLDLMYGLPGQDLAAARRDVDAALALAPPHLSFYQLTLEPNTLFHRHPPELPDEDTTAGIEDLVEERLAAAGYEHYETSAHARPGHACRHNLNYWEFGDYLGIGAGAHSKLSFPDRIVRELRWKQPAQYLRQIDQGEPRMEATPVTRDAVGFEFMLNALRLRAGVPAALFAERTGFDIALVQHELADAVHRGLIEPDPTAIRPTALGRRFLNDLQALFLRDESPSIPASPAGVRTVAGQPS